MHSALFELFSSFIGDGDNVYPVAYAIWHMFQSDKSQREMVLAVAAAIYPPRSLLLKQIRWLLRMADKIAPYRNAAVHVPTYFVEYLPGRANALMLDEVSAREQARIRLELAGAGKRFWTAMAGDLFVLGQFAFALVDARSVKDGSAHIPSLRRPQLLSLRRIAEIERQMSPPQVRKAPARQRRASKAKSSTKPVSGS